MILQSVWGSGSDRRTEIETVTGDASLQRRLAELGYAMLGSDTLPATDDVPNPDAEPVVADHLGKIGAEQLAHRIRAY